MQAEGFALSTPTSPFLKGWTPKSMDLFQKVIDFALHARVSAFFKPRRGRLKMSVAPTGKLKADVSPLRKAKENEGLT